MKLVAFGDSFTFGQGTVIPLKDHETESHLEWRKVSNDAAYPNAIKNKLNFKSVENFSMPGASNSGIMSTMRSYYNSNPTNKDVLYLIGLTTPDRDWIMRYMDHKEKYDPVDFTYNHWLQGHNHNKNARKPGGFDSPLYYGISKQGMEQYLTHYWNNFTILLKHAEFYFSLIDFFESKQLNYIILDIVNDTVSKVEKYNLLSKISFSGWHRIFKDEYNMNNIVNNYYIEALNNKRYLNKFNLEDNTSDDFKIDKNIENLNTYILDYGVQHYGDMSKFLSSIPGDKHWNKEGHILVSNVVSNFILKNYGERK